MGVTEHSSCQDHFSENVKIDSESYPVRDYYWQIVRQYLSCDNSSLVFRALQEISSFYKRTFRESGVAAVEHPVEVALLLCGQWIPGALHNSAHARAWIESSCDRRRFLQLQTLSEILGVDVFHQDFARYFSLIPYRAFLRMRESFAPRTVLAHLLALLHDRIEDDPRVIRDNFSPDALISQVVSSYPLYTDLLSELLNKISYLKTRRIDGTSSKLDYIRAMYLASPLALFIKGLDVLSNAITIRDLQDKVTFDGVRSAAQRQRDKIAEYFWYVNLLIDLGHPFADLLADVLYAQSLPTSFLEYYRLYSEQSALYYERIGPFFTNVQKVVGERGLCRLDFGGVYRAFRRSQRGFYDQDLQAAFAPRIVIHTRSFEDKTAIVGLLSNAFFSTISPTVPRHSQCIYHENAGYTEVLVPMEGGYSLLFVVTEPDSAWKFSALEESLFSYGSSHVNTLSFWSQFLPQRFLSSYPLHSRNLALLQEYLQVYALSLPEDAELALRQLQAEPIRDLIRVRVCVQGQNFAVFLPVDSCGLDLYVRLCSILQQHGFSCDPMQIHLTGKDTGAILSFDGSVIHNCEYILSFHSSDFAQTSYAFSSCRFVA